MAEPEKNRKFWEDYLQSLPPEAGKPELFDSWAFGHTPEHADQLGALVLAGTKTATASLVWGYESGVEQFPQAGQYSLILDGAGDPLCILQTTAVEVRPFEEVDAVHAHLEGDGDLSLDYWREVHWRFFSEECAQLGKTPDRRMPVCCERFRLCYPPAKS